MPHKNHKEEGVKANIRLGNRVLEQVQEFCYLESTITKDKSLAEVKRRAALIKQAFKNKRTYFLINTSVLK